MIETAKDWIGQADLALQNVMGQIDPWLSSPAGQIALAAALFFGALFFMEFAAWFVHKYIMHGFMWGLHKSHHQPDPHSFFEKNDWFAVFFSMPSILLIYIGLHHYWPILWIGLGIAAYGFIYFVFHDIIVHQRLKLRVRPDGGYLRHIIEAHVIHHHVTQKRGAVSFGFLFAPSLTHLRNRLKKNKAEGLVD